MQRVCIYALRTIQERWTKQICRIVALGKERFEDEAQDTAIVPVY